jgi:hypothetical protein
MQGILSLRFATRSVFLGYIFFAVLRLTLVFVVDFLLIREEESSSSSSTTMAPNSSATVVSLLCALLAVAFAVLAQAAPTKFPFTGRLLLRREPPPPKNSMPGHTAMSHPAAPISGRHRHASLGEHLTGV